MLFHKNIEPRCAYCAHGASLGENKVLCAKKGVVSPGFHCPRFRYDPLKRVPPKPAVLDTGKLPDDAFQLD